MGTVVHNQQDQRIELNALDLIESYREQLGEAHHTVAVLQAKIKKMEREGVAGTGASAPVMGSTGGPMGGGQKSPGVERAELRWAVDPESTVGGDQPLRSEGDKD